MRSAPTSRGAVGPPSTASKGSPLSPCPALGGMGHPGPAVPDRCLPTPIGQAVSYLAPTAQVPLEAPTVMPSGLSATTAFASGAIPVDALNPALDTYNVALFDCAHRYPLNSPATNACGDKLWGAFSGSRYLSNADARHSMPYEDGCPPERSSGASLGHGIAGRVFSSPGPGYTGPPQPSHFCYLSWTEGDWSFYVEDSTEARAIATGKSLVAYLNTYLLPETIGNIFVGSNSSTASWVWGDHYYTTTATDPVEAARLAVNMRSVETPAVDLPGLSSTAVTIGHADALQACEANTLGTSEAQYAAVASGAIEAASVAAQQAASSDPQWQSLASVTAFQTSLPETSNTAINIDEAGADGSMADAICQTLRPSFPDIGRVDITAACRAYLGNGPGDPAQLADQAAGFEPQWSGLAADISASDYFDASAQCASLRSEDATLGRANAQAACATFGSGSQPDARAAFSEEAQLAASLDPKWVTLATEMSLAAWHEPHKGAANQLPTGCAPLLNNG